MTLKLIARSISLGPERRGIATPPDPADDLARVSAATR